MVGRTVKSRSRISFRRPSALQQRADNQPIPHAPKKSAIAITGTRPDRLCAICLGRLEAGAIMTFCECGKFFHLSCISEMIKCPICSHEFAFCRQDREKEDEPGSKDEIEHNGDTVETVFQCPVCYSYVREDAQVCQCGAVFDSEEEIYLCPGCGCDVSKDAASCPQCNMKYD